MPGGTGRRMSPMFWPKVGEKRGKNPTDQSVVFSFNRPKSYIPKPNPTYSLSFATKRLKRYIPTPK